MRQICQAARARIKRERDETVATERVARGLSARPQKRGLKSPTPVKARVRASESDDYVVANLDAELVPIWQEEKRRWPASKWTPHRRYEEFIEWVHEHEGQVAERLASAGDSWDDASYARAEREHRSL